MSMSGDRRFVNPAQPQTLQIAVFLLYFNAAFLLLAMLLNAGLPLINLAFVAGGAIAAFGIANERRWAYFLGIAIAILPFVLRFWLYGNPLGVNFISLLFEIALVALLVHPQSRDYQRIWFK
ncbi:MAG TPA: hypothetical protein VE760_04700 [Acidimicrobiales bacterium]|nr:hypothetical protein [Acidimicrobiales bacterium]